jgi:ribosome-associated protein
MKTENIQQLALDALDDLKALDITVLDVRTLTTLADTMIVCSGRSNRHVKSLAENVVVCAKKHQLSYIKMEGQREGEWVIVDLADVIVHVMLPTTRAFYNLEDLWESAQEAREQHAHSSASRR